MRNVWFVILVGTIVSGVNNWSYSRVVELVKAAALEHLIEPGLPGQVPAQVSFQQYAGYIVTDAAAGRALFYYFVQADSYPLSKPLTLWLNGGPGCSSVGYGAFQELGPFRPNGTARGLLLNPDSWNKVKTKVLNLGWVQTAAAKKEGKIVVASISVHTRWQQCRVYKVCERAAEEFSRGEGRSPDKWRARRHRCRIFTDQTFPTQQNTPSTNLLPVVV